MEANGPDPASNYAAALGALATVLVDAPSLHTTLLRLLEVATAAAPGIDALTVTAITEDGELTSAASTDDDAEGVDQFEYTIEEGPCIAALETGDEQLVTDIAADDRWPRFAHRASEAGFGSIAGIPLRAPNGAVIGALDIFSTVADGIGEADLEILRRVATPAATVLSNARAYRRTRELSEQLATTLEQRATINRAVGIVLGRHGGAPERAERILEATAAREGSDVLALATRLVAGEEVDLATPEGPTTSG